MSQNQNLKRKAPFEIDSIMKGQTDEANDKNEDVGKVSTQEEIQRRKIVKILGPKNEVSTSNQGNIQFHLTSKLQETNNPGQNQSQQNTGNQEKKSFSFIQQNDMQARQMNSIFQKSLTPGKVSAQKDQKPPQETQPKGQNDNKEKKPEELKIETTKQDKQPESNKEEKKSLSKQQAVQQQQQQQSQATSENKINSSQTNNNTQSKIGGTGLFANLFSVNNKLLDQKPSFPLLNNSSGAKGTGIFSNLLVDSINPSKQMAGTFSFLNNSSTPNTQTTGSLGTQLALNLIQKQQQPKNNQDSEEEGDDDQCDDDEHKSDEIDPSKTEKVEIKNPYQTLIEKPILKFRKNDGELLEKGSLSMEKSKDKDNIVTIIYRNQIKQVIYQGFILPKLSKIRNINQKKENINLITFYQQQKKDTNNTQITDWKADNLKIMFNQAQDGIEFYREIEKILEKKEEK